MVQVKSFLGEGQKQHHGMGFEIHLTLASNSNYTTRVYSLIYNLYHRVASKCAMVTNCYIYGTEGWKGPLFCE